VEEKMINVWYKFTVEFEKRPKFVKVQYYAFRVYLFLAKP